MNADRILVLDRGRIVERGTHEELIAGRGLYRRLWEIQTSFEEDLEHDLARAGAGLMATARAAPTSTTEPDLECIVTGDGPPTDVLRAAEALPQFEREAK